MRDRDLPATERLAAARELATDLTKGKPGWDRVAAQSGRKAPAVAFPAALALAGARDERGGRALRRWLGSDDEGLAALAALHLVSDTGDRSAADRLAELAESRETRFRLAAGRALAGIGNDRANRFSFESLPGCRIRRVENGIRRAYLVVDECDVGVVVTGPTFWVEGFGRASSRYYFYWVHTTTPYRRLGLARTGLLAAERSRWNRACSVTSLHAMSDYVAHALYRERGMIDSRGFDEFEKRVGMVRTPAPRGVRVRPAADSDVEAVADLIRRVHGAGPHPSDVTADWIGDRATRLAERDGEIVGVAAVALREPKAVLREFAVAEIPDVEDPKGKFRAKGTDLRERVGRALLASLESELRRRGVESVAAPTWYHYGDRFHRRVLQLAGFAGSVQGLVEQARVNDLARYLRELRGMLRERGQGGDGPTAWRGTIAFDGGRLRAALHLERGRVTVLPKPPRSSSILLAGGDEPIERMVLGVTSPFDEWSQGEIEIRPPLSPDSRKLLETLFPRRDR